MSDSKVPGIWLEPENITPARAESVLQANPNARAAWIGTKGGPDPKIMVYGRDGRQEPMHHAPAESFRERLTELTADWPAGENATHHSAVDETEAAANFILNAGKQTT